MTAAGLMRSDEIEHRKNLVIALASSLAVHGALFGAWLLLGVAIITAHLAAVEKIKKEVQSAEQRRQQEEPPLVFIEVMPEQATPEPPRESKFYSTANSQAANPDVLVETKAPKIDGSQTKVAKTVETLRPQPEVLKPAVTVKAQPEEIEPKPETAKPPGDLTLLTPVKKPTPEEPQKPRRPRTVAEAKAQMGMLVGEKMNQEGGVRNIKFESVDARQTPFASYDAEFIAAVQNCWYKVLDENERKYALRPGKVAIEFRMHCDGRVSEVRVVEEDVGDILALFCRKAISDPSPYKPWPSDMRRMIGKDFRDVRFTFFYM